MSGFTAEPLSAAKAVYQNYNCGSTLNNGDASFFNFQAVCIKKMRPLLPLPVLSGKKLIPFPVAPGYQVMRQRDSHVRLESAQALVGKIQHKNIADCFGLHYNAVNT